MESRPDMARHVLQSVFDGLRSHPRADGLGRVIQILSAKSQAGTSHVARNLALMAARQLPPDGKRVGLFDCDFSQLAQTNYFFAAHRSQHMQGPYDAGFGEAGFWQIAHNNGTHSESPHIYGLYLEGQTGLAVTTLFWDQIPQSDRVSLRRAQAYWQVLRSHFSYVFVDCPALDRSSDGLTLTPDCDGTILVAHADQANDPAHIRARQMISQSGGRYVGLLLNAGSPIRAVPQTLQPHNTHFQAD